MAENKDARQRSFLSSFPLLTPANLLFSVLDDRGELLRGRDSLRDAAFRDRCGAPADQHRLSCHAVAHLAGSLSDIRNHAIMNTVVILAAFLTWASGTMCPDVLPASGFYM